MVKQDKFDNLVKMHLAYLDLTNIPAIRSWETNKAMYDRIVEMCDNVESLTASIQNTLIRDNDADRDVFLATTHLRIEAENVCDALSSLDDIIEGMKNVEGLVYVLSNGDVQPLVEGVISYSSDLVGMDFFDTYPEEYEAIMPYVHELTETCETILAFLDAECANKEQADHLISLYDEEYATHLAA